MLNKLFMLFSENEPTRKSTEMFTEMLRIVEHLVVDASHIYWGRHVTLDEKQGLYTDDIQVNRLQRKIRKEIMFSLAGFATSDVPYGLMLMSLVKDVERIGDYAKNLAEVHELTETGFGDLPKDELTHRLREVADFIENHSKSVIDIYINSDAESASSISHLMRTLASLCDQIIEGAARNGYDGAVAVNLALAARYYKRILAHFLNLMSSLLMPLHRLDYAEKHDSKTHR